MKFSDDAKCEHCGERRRNGTLRFNIEGVGGGLMSSKSNYPIRMPTFYLACKNPECLAKDLDKMRSDLLSKFPSNKTNAVGPTAPGAPGCAFNDPPNKK